VPGPARDDETLGPATAAPGIPGVRDIVAELQEALLPTALPVLPRARIAARYMVAGHEQSAGGDWFDAIPLAGGRVALVVGDVVGHGVAASAAMGQLRAVLAELLAAEEDLGQVLRRTDAFAARMPTLRAATLALAVLDPVGGQLRYTTCGHPPPLVIGTGGTARYLAGTKTGPLGTGSPPVLATGALTPGELVLLYSDGLIERPDRTAAEGMAELAAVAADAAVNQALTLGADPATAERVCQLTVELLTRGGHADDITALAAQWLAEPAPPLHLELPSERPSLTAARDVFANWLSRLDVAADDREALHLAMVEVFTNAIEHAYPREAPGIIGLDAVLGDDGHMECRVTDRGRWRPPGVDDTDRGYGLMVAGHVVDQLVVSHPPQPAGGPPGSGGTVVTLRHRLRRPAILSPGRNDAPAAKPAEPLFGVDTSVAAGASARAVVRGPVNITTSDLLARRLLSASRGGTVPLVADLTGVTQLASAGVQALYAVSARLAAHGQNLTLVTAPTSAAQAVLDLVRLDHVTGDEALGRRDVPDVAAALRRHDDDGRAADLDLVALLQALGAEHAAPVEPGAVGRAEVLYVPVAVRELEQAVLAGGMLVADDQGTLPAGGELLVEGAGLAAGLDDDRRGAFAVGHRMVALSRDGGHRGPPGRLLLRGDVFPRREGT
jgi:anti-sigma regulatory factor (Ser/Thr protein kinase)/anti-anti-sigma regulatory factor